MRFDRPADGATMELRHPRAWFFVFGPFYLLWLRLWADAAVVGMAVWVVARGAALVTRRLAGGGAFDLQRALAALDTIRASRGRTAAGDAALRELVEMSLPIYAAGFALVLLMAVLAAALPRYLRWRYRKRGWQVIEGDALRSSRFARAR